MFSTIQTELRKPAHYLSMRKREQAANHIDRLEKAMNQYSKDEMRLTHQSTIAAQAEQIEALTAVIVNRDWIIKQLLPQPAVDINDLVKEFEAMPNGLTAMENGRQWVREISAQPVQPDPRGTDAQIRKERELTASAILGAMMYGYQNVEYPPDDADWLRPFWEMGRREAERESVIAQPDLCRQDGRCQYAIDHGAEGLGHCPSGKCAQPVQPAEPVAMTDERIIEIRKQTSGSAYTEPFADSIAFARAILAVSTKETP